MGSLIWWLTVLGLVTLSIGTVAIAFWYGLKGGHELQIESLVDSPAVSAWRTRAEQVESAYVEVQSDADTVADVEIEEDEEAKKARKRAEALARKAARQAKKADS